MEAQCSTLIRPFRISHQDRFRRFPVSLRAGGARRKQPVPRSHCAPSRKQVNTALLGCVLLSSL